MEGSLRARWRYRCDFGHPGAAWEVAGRDAAPPIEDPRCCDGHEAVNEACYLPADEVQVLLRPVAWVSKQDGNAAISGGARTYKLVLLDRADCELLESAADYGWDEAVKIAQRFRGKTSKEATKWWSLKPP